MTLPEHDLSGFGTAYRMLIPRLQAVAAGIRRASGRAYRHPRGDAPLPPECVLPSWKMREEHMRTALILNRTAAMLDEALHGRARFEVREEAYDALAAARRRVADLDVILFPAAPSQESRP